MKRVREYCCILDVYILANTLKLKLISLNAGVLVQHAASFFQNISTALFDDQHILCVKIEER